MSLSPDSRRVAVTRSVEGNVDLWLLDGARMRRATFDASVDQLPLWSPDSTRVAFNSNRTGQFDLYQKLTSGAGVDERLVASDQFKAPTSWSADGRFLLYYSTDPQTSEDLWILPMTGERTPSLFLKTPFRETWGAFSPDGRWVAYMSNESGRMEIYVRPFAEPAASGADATPSGGQWQSLDGRRPLPAMATRRQGTVLSQRGGRDDGGDDHGRWSRRSHRARR